MVLRWANHVALRRVRVAEHEIVDPALKSTLQDDSGQGSDGERVVLAVLGVPKHHAALLQIHVRPAQRRGLDGPTGSNQ